MPTVGFTKIDVERNEIEVVRGVLQLIRRDPPKMLIEVDRNSAPDASHPVLGTIQRILEMLPGYEVVFLLNGRWCPISEFDLDRHQKHTLDAYRMHSDRYTNNVPFRPFA